MKVLRQSKPLAHFTIGLKKNGADWRIRVKQTIFRAAVRRPSSKINHLLTFADKGGHGLSMEQSLYRSKAPRVVDSWTKMKWSNRFDLQLVAVSCNAITNDIIRVLRLGHLEISPYCSSASIYGIVCVDLSCHDKLFEFSMPVCINVDEKG